MLVDDKTIEAMCKAHQDNLSGGRIGQNWESLAGYYKERAREDMRAAVACIPVACPTREEVARELLAADWHPHAAVPWEQLARGDQAALLHQADRALALCAGRVPAEVAGLVDAWEAEANRAIEDGSPAEHRAMAVALCAKELRAALQSLPRPAPDDDVFETRADGKRVRKDRWETAIRLRGLAAETRRQIEERRHMRSDQIAAHNAVADTYEGAADRLEAALRADQLADTPKPAGADEAEADGPTYAQLQKSHDLALEQVRDLESQLAAVTQERDALKQPRADIGDIDYKRLLQQRQSEWDAQARAYVQQIKGLEKRAQRAEDERGRARCERDEALAKLAKAEQAQATLLCLEHDYCIEGDYAPDSADDTRHPVTRRMEAMQATLVEFSRKLAELEKTRAELADCQARLKGTLALADERSADKARVEHELLEARAELEACRARRYAGEGEIIVDSAEYGRQHLDWLTSHNELSALRERHEALRAGVEDAVDWAFQHVNRIPPVGTKQRGYVECAQEVHRQLCALLKPAPAQYHPNDLDDVDGDVSQLPGRISDTDEELAAALSCACEGGEPMCSLAHEAARRLRATGALQERISRLEAVAHPPVEFGRLVGRVEAVEMSTSITDADLRDVVRALRPFLQSMAGEGDPQRWRAAKAALDALDARKGGV